MNRRQFVATGTAGLALASRVGPRRGSASLAPKRVGLIGWGWYGKCDLFRLIQVAPVEVVSLCDVDRKMLAEAAEMVAARQASKKTPRTYGDYREMLKEKDLDIVLIATPDHWHALPMIAAVEAGADVYVQKPISVDVVEGQAMVAAARKHGRVVQVGTQRRSTPHLIEARDRIVREGKLGKIGLVEVYCYYHMRAQTTRPTPTRPKISTGRCGPARRRCGRTIALVHPRGWRAFTEYGNGIMGDMCIHMLDMVRWMLGLGWPKRIASTGGILVDKASKANIPDTQTATFDFGDLHGRLAASHLGPAGRPQVSLGRDLLRRQGDAQGRRLRLRLHPARARARRSTAMSPTSWSSTPRTRPRRTWRSTSPRRFAGT